VGVNDRSYLIDAAVDHAIDLVHYSNDVVRRVRALMRNVDTDLVTRLTIALQDLDPTSFTVRRLQELMSGIRGIDLEMQAKIIGEVTPELRKLAEYEHEYQQRLFGGVIRTPSLEQIHAAATSKPFQGRLLSEWFSELASTRQRRLSNAVAVGFTEGRTIDEIVRTIRGRRDQNFKDGILEIGKREAEAVVRTAVSHTAASVREEVYKRNDDLFTAEEWVSTLDSRTTPLCQIRDGLQYTTVEHDPIGHKVPWGAGPGRIHWGCRSVSIPVLKREFTDVFGAPATRASVDGPVSADTKYGAWLLRQSASRQDEILGPTRGLLLRKGGIKFDRFFNNEGRFLTLDQMRERDAAAFARAKL
jgi:hypothetical protein